MVDAVALAVVATPEKPSFHCLKLYLFGICLDARKGPNGDNLEKPQVRRRAF